MIFEYYIEGGDFSNAGTISSEIKKIMKQLNLPSSFIKRVVVALYEAEVNIVAHAYSGKITTDINTERILIKLEDQGPGIKDIEKAMEKGYSTASNKVREMGFGAGMGLYNIKKNTDIFHISSEVNKGTVVQLTHYIK